ncbi:MAG TPA: prepilin-type N-terminal cleavage/methylation domain-containing protein [Pseudoduganella sp.]
MKRITLPPRGFTLVELLVAITVLAIVAVLGWRGLDGIVRSREQLTAQMEQTRGIQLAFAQLQSDLEQIADKGTVLNNHQNLMADNTRLVFIRTVLTENAPTQLQVVSYRIRDGILSRRESPSTRDLVQLDALWQAALGDAGGDVQREVALHGGVNGMGVRVWENGAWKQPENASTSFSNVTQSSGEVPCTSTEPGACQGQGESSTGTAPLGPSGQPVPQVALPQSGPTGIEVSLQIQGLPNALAKIFLLGAV